MRAFTSWRYIFISLSLSAIGHRDRYFVPIRTVDKVECMYDHKFWIAQVRLVIRRSKTFGSVLKGRNKNLLQLVRNHQRVSAKERVERKFPRRAFLQIFKAGTTYRLILKGTEFGET